MFFEDPWVICLKERIVSKIRYEYEKNEELKEKIKKDFEELDKYLSERK